MLRRMLWSLIAVSGLVVAGAPGQTLPVPMKPDPGFAIDGDLSDWAKVPGAIAVNRADQVVSGRSAWTSPEDLSATIRLAWRYDHLFVAAEVIDDQFFAPQRADGALRGDHVELTLDVSPTTDAQRDEFGEGQYRFLFSPGNLNGEGNRPEASCVFPAAGKADGIVVAAVRTKTGWNLEAAVPWGLLNVKPTTAFPLRVEVGVRDTDSDDPQQDSILTIGDKPWNALRSRLQNACLTNADGVVQAEAEVSEVFKSIRLEVGKKESVAFTLPAKPSGREAVLLLEARLESDRPAGYNPALRLLLNDKPVTGERFVGRPAKVKARDGRTSSLMAGDLITVFYSPDFTSVDTNPTYGLQGGIKACELALLVSDLVREGENTLVVENAALGGVTRLLVAADGRIAYREPAPPPPPKAGPPTGPLARVEPRASLQTEYTLNALPDSRIEVTVAGETYVVASRFSTPDEGWVHGSCKGFHHERAVERKAEAIVIRDTFKNLTGGNLPLMQRHEVAMGSAQSKIWLAGLEQLGNSGAASSPENPTLYFAAGKAGVGLLPVDDTFRIHVAALFSSASGGIADNSFVLAAGATHSSEWAIIPTDVPDYWTFINAARRVMDANFTIDGGFAFLRGSSPVLEWSDEQTKRFIEFKDAKYLCASIAYPFYKGRYSHGTAFQMVERDGYKNAVDRWRRLAPEAKALVYFHCFIDVVDESPDTFADARVLGPNGAQVDYGEPYDRIFFPTTTNTYGKAVGKNVDLILDEIKADGVYWDEHEYSRWHYHYGEPWDGVTGNIDGESGKLLGLKSSVTLLSEAWRVAMAKRILAKGPLIGNGPPYTRAMAALKFPCFVETGSISNCASAQLYSPIALGDHLTERSELDAYHVMLAALDYGCVYHWYNDVTVVPTHHHLTRYMYPITPMELHEGCIIGAERIITKKSGLYGWGDASGHEVHVFDDNGNEVPNFDAPAAVQDGRNYTELRLAEDWSAAIIRLP